MKTYFLDFEASSLDEGSYPIEIAWVDQTGQGESYLINPHFSWSGWSAASENVHHITQDMLRDATSAERVARRAQTVLAGALLVSDSAAFEEYWLGRLLKVIDAPPLRVHDVHALIGQEIKRVTAAIVAAPDSREWHRQSRLYLDSAQTAAMAAYEGTRIGLHHAHRALPDAMEVWRGWHAAKQAVDQLCRQIATE